MIAGLLLSRQLTRRAKLMLLAPAAYFTIVHALSVGSLRYRVPVEPELAVIAGSGAAAIFSGRRHGVANENDQFPNPKSQ